MVSDTPDLTEEELLRLAEEGVKEEIITVTGSTIERKTLTTPAPVTILSKSDLTAAGRATVGDIIQSLPAQSNAINAQVNNGGDGSTRVDIRGLGTARTLVLLNGRRLAPGGLGANASVDLNAIPLAVIERVEVLKDGASAVYGSDAIGGVVNVITRTDFEGTEVNLYTGGSQRGDGLSYDASFVTGHNSANKKGNLIFSAGFQNQRPVFAGERAYSDADMTFNFASRTESPSGSTATPNGRLNTRLTDQNGDGRADPGFSLCGDGVVFCTRDTATGGWRAFDQATDLYNFQPVNYLYTPSSRYNVFTAGSYKFAKNFEAFFEGAFLNRRSDQQLAPEPFAAATTISKDSMYNDLGVDVLDLRRRLEEFGPRRSLQNIDTFQMVAGFKGKAPEDLKVLKDWKWEVSYNYGHTEAIQRNEGNLVLSRLSNALGPSMRDMNNNPICVRTPGDASTQIPDCVPLNILGPSGSIDDPAAIDYVTYTGISNGYNELQTAAAGAHGRIMKLPNGGDIALAVGADYRYAAGGTTPDPLTATGDTTGNASAPTEGSYNVIEGFGELSIVPISGKKFAQWAEINLAARAFRYNTFGSGLTWKAGGLFRTINGFAVRGTYSTAFRAPSISELYRGSADSFPAATDPCDTTPPTAMGMTVALDPAVAERCRAQGVPDGSRFGTSQQRAILSGTPTLVAETANVATAGIVFEPPQVKGLAMTVDYWRINIDQAIQTLGANVILSNCYVRGRQEYCDAIHRDPLRGFEIDFIENPVANVGGTKTTGMDFAISYDRKFGKFGRVRPQLEAQRLFIFDLDNTTILHGRGVYDLGVYPLWKWNLSTQWSHQSGAGGGVNFRYVGDFNECESNDCNGGKRSRNVDRWYKADVYGSYNLKTPAGTTTISAGVNNVLDRKPSLIYVGFSSDSDAATYDYMGRFFYARLTQLF